MDFTENYPVLGKQSTFMKVSNAARGDKRPIDQAKVWKEFLDYHFIEFLNVPIRSSNVGIFRKHSTFRRRLYTIAKDSFKA